VKRFIQFCPKLTKRPSGLKLSFETSKKWKERKNNREGLSLVFDLPFSSSLSKTERERERDCHWNFFFGVGWAEQVTMCFFAEISFLFWSSVEISQKCSLLLKCLFGGFIQVCNYKNRIVLKWYSETFIIVFFPLVFLIWVTKSGSCVYLAYDISVDEKFLLAPLQLFSEWNSLSLSLSNTLAHSHTFALEIRVQKKTGKNGRLGERERETAQVSF